MELPFSRGVFIKELKNRFLAEVELNGKIELCYLPSSCKLSPLIDLSGRETLLLPIKKKNSRTKYAAYAVKDGKNYILLNLGQCNNIIEKEIHRRLFSFLGKRERLLHEINVAGYKADLFIEDTNTVIEIKSILSTTKKTRFPSVQSKRALEQLKKLSSLLNKGYAVCYIFVSVNQETKVISIDESNDEYCRLFKTCIDKGMTCYGFSISLEKGEARINRRLKVNV